MTCGIGYTRRNHRSSGPLPMNSYNSSVVAQERLGIFLDRQGGD